MSRHGHRHRSHAALAVRRSRLAPDTPTGLSMKLEIRSDNCPAGEGRCTKPTSTNYLPIALGAIIPIVSCIVVLLWLHRRHMRKLAREDAMDKTKSMDFGMGISRATAAEHDPNREKESRSRRQVSLDLDIASPYLMPGIAHESRESLNSMARSAHTLDDRYCRPTTPGSNTKAQRHQLRDRDSSHYAPSGYDNSPDGSQTSMNAELLTSAQRMPTSSPPRSRSPESGNSPAGVQVSEQRIGDLPSGPPIDLSGSMDDRDQGARSSGSAGRLPPSLKVGNETVDDGTSSPFDDPDLGASQPQETQNSIQFRFSTASASDISLEATASDNAARKSLAPAAFDVRRLSMGFRPLPPEGNPDDTAEERAMRIRSFYKEYFAVEDSGPPPPLPTIQHAHMGYSEEYGMAEDAAIFDPETGRFIMPGVKPFAEHPMRRAMTPPPRMPPQFDHRPRAGSVTGRPFVPSGPRSYSSASGRIRAPPHGSGRPAIRRPVEPPKPLNILPTPSKVSEDAFASPISFAPPVRINRDGEMSSPLGGLRPYSPSVAPHNPLVSSFDDLSALPTPHMLRKSGTFTALDFAPPRKFKNEDVNDAGSIRSNRSGVSALQVHNIRNGAYRVSRIPTEVVPLKTEISAELRPTWEMRPHPT